VSDILHVAAKRSRQQQQHQRPHNASQHSQRPNGLNTVSSGNSVRCRRLPHTSVQGRTYSSSTLVPYLLSFLRFRLSIGVYAHVSVLECVIFAARVTRTSFKRVLLLLLFAVLPMASLSLTVGGRVRRRCVCNVRDDCFFAPQNMHTTLILTRIQCVKRAHITSNHNNALPTGVVWCVCIVGISVSSNLC